VNWGYSFTQLLATLLQKDLTLGSPQSGKPLSYQPISSSVDVHNYFKRFKTTKHELFQPSQHLPWPLLPQATGDKSFS
jgi:hypothetical protein